MTLSLREAEDGEERYFHVKARSFVSLFCILLGLGRALAWEPGHIHCQSGNES